MSRRRLSPEETALWERVIASVAPLVAVRPKPRRMAGPPSESEETGVGRKPSARASADKRAAKNVLPVPVDEPSRRARPRPVSPSREGGAGELWAQVVASVKPLRPAASVAVVRRVSAPPPAKAVTKTPAVAPPPPPQTAPPAKQGRANTLDASWDRRLSRGLVAPESSIDLHGHSLASAYDRLDRGLDQAIRRGDRVLLLVTGKPPRPESERPHARGAIRAAVGDWLASSRHADRIAAVRGAHPRHGGAGALYIVLRRTRGEG